MRRAVRALEVAEYRSLALAQLLLRDGFDTDLPLISLHTEPGDLTVHVGCILHGTRPPRTRDRTVVYTTSSLPDLPGETKQQAFAVPDLSRVRSTV